VCDLRDAIAVQINVDALNRFISVGEVSYLHSGVVGLPIFVIKNGSQHLAFDESHGLGV
jgi:hypothetical protein